MAGSARAFLKRIKLQNKQLSVGFNKSTHAVQFMRRSNLRAQTIETTSAICSPANSPTTNERS